MPDKNEKERRKQIFRALQAKEKAAFEQGLPAPYSLLKNLMDMLDIELSEADCDHTLRFTEMFLRRNHITDTQPILDWLQEQGGFCDCEVLANVEHYFYT